MVREELLKVIEAFESRTDDVEPVLEVAEQGVVERLQQRDELEQDEDEEELDEKERKAREQRSQQKPTFRDLGIVGEIGRAGRWISRLIFGEKKDEKKENNI